MRDDRRNARRFPVLDEHQHATLRVGDVAVPVRLLDQSATGFSIRVEDHPGVFPGELVWLQTVAGWTEVRVVKARHDVDGTQIGLERIADLATGPKDIGRIIPEQMAQENPGTNPWPLVGMVLALLALLGFMGWTAIGKRQVDPAALFQPQGPVDLRPAAVRAIQHEASRRAADLHKSVQRLGTAMLTLPEVVEHLKLSQQQQSQLRQIVEIVAKEEQNTRRAARAGSNRAVEARLQQLHELAAEQALQVLDEDQRSQWQSMFDDALKHLQEGVHASDKHAPQTPEGSKSR